jgi:hypothetical protein
MRDDDDNWRGAWGSRFFHNLPQNDWRGPRSDAFNARDNLPPDDWRRTAALRAFKTDAIYDRVSALGKTRDADFPDLADASNLDFCPPHRPRSSLEVGMPTIPEGSLSAERIILLSKWLRGCNENHKHGTLIPLLPTRVIDVRNQGRLRLYDTGKYEHGYYIALSHRWDDNTERCKTTKDNIRDRLERLDPTTLSKTFQEAVFLTRELGIQFLWIDSLCIIQGHDGDWDRESMDMERVFASAYCTIAASPDKETDGFLHRSHITPMGESANFDQDVGNSVLNQRGWVLQERALSRRTIHFTVKQTYWECESAVWCETNNR